MKVAKKVKKEYSVKDDKFPLNGEYAKLLIKSHGLTYAKVGEPAGVSENAVGSWVNNRSLAPREKVLKAFKQMNVTEDDLHTLVLEHPSEEVRQRLQKNLDQAREAYERSQAGKSNKQTDVDFDKLADRIVKLTESINRVEQNQKEIMSFLNQFAHDRDKQQLYLVQELKEIKKAQREKNEIIRGFQG